ncbi:MAG: galactose ABC transporter substrate-binding protein [Lachnospiraceae bacterium]|nr:galactose ABC transporter substrate-binding protein [Lachnospiraceae bacterium]
MKKLRNPIIYVLVMTLFLAGCSGSGVVGDQVKKQRNIRIGVSMNDVYDTFIVELSARLNEWAREIEKETGDVILLDIVSAGGSQLAQNDQITGFIDRGYDVVCVNLVDRTDATVIIDKAKSASVPVVFFNREPVADDLNRWDKLYYVGANAEQSGMMQAELVIKALSDKKRFSQVDRNDDGVIQYVILEGEIGHQDALIRTQVSIEAIQQAGYSIEKLGDEIANWNRDQAESKMGMLLDKYPTQIEMIISNNDEMAIGALEAVKHKGAYQPLVVGVDGIPDALSLVQMKKMEGTVYNDAQGQAENIMRLSCDLARKSGDEAGKDAENRSIYVDYRIIDYNNVQEFIRLK